MAGEHQAQRQPSDSRLRRGPRQAGAEVPVSQPTQDQLGRLEVVHPGGQAAKGPQTTSTSVGYSAPAEVPRGTRRPAGTGSRRRRSPASLPGRQGPAPCRRQDVTGKHLGGGHAALRQLTRQPQRLQSGQMATTAAPVGTDLETAGWLPQSRPCDSARMRAQVCLVRWWSSAAASETCIGRLLAQEPATAAQLPERPHACMVCSQTLPDDNPAGETQHARAARRCGPQRGEPKEGRQVAAPPCGVNRSEPPRPLRSTSPRGCSSYR